MAEQLDYARHGQRGIVYGLTVVTAFCFALPFVLFYIEINAHPGVVEAPLGAAAPALLLWVASGILGVVGLVAGVLSWKRRGPNFWLVTATLFDGSVAGIFLLVVAAVAVRSLVRGY